MTRANDVNQRVILLATNSSQSIIVESVEGKINTIGYTAYGEQSAQQKVATALGFNGQLREARFGWYILGKGYRVYNPRLMRFHSPDSWSPFGGGGLNAYMYCVGDPVNRVDPTGHMTFLKFLSKSFDFFFGGSEITGPSRSRAFAATGATGRRMSVEHGDLAAMSTAGGAVAARSPTVITTGRYPSMGDGNTHQMRWGNTAQSAPPMAPQKIGAPSTKGPDRSVRFHQNAKQYDGPSAYNPRREQNHLNGGEVLPRRNHWPSDETISSTGSSGTNASNTTAGLSIHSDRYSRASSLRDLEESWRRLNEMERDRGWSSNDSFHSAGSSIRSR